MGPKGSLARLFWEWLKGQSPKKGATKSPPATPPPTKKAKTGLKARKKRPRQISSSPEATPPPKPPKKKQRKKGKQQKKTNKGRRTINELAHAALPRGYIPAVITLGAPNRQGKLVVRTALQKALGDNCRVNKSTHQRLENLLVEFISTFTKYVNNNKNLHQAKEQYVKEHQQYFLV